MEKILTTAVTTIRQTLDADRVTVFRFDADGAGTAIARSRRKARTPLSEPSPDGPYTLDAPIMRSGGDGTAEVWGLLMVRAHPRAQNWDLATPSFLRRLADQLAIAIRQSELYREAQTQLTRHRQIADRLQHDVLHDTLTGLPNRTALMKRLCQVCQPREPGDGFSKFAILFLDFNGFKKINDSWGHAAGDRVLKIVARRLQTCIRDTDLVARLGGDEFVILLEPIREIADAIEVGDRIHQVLQGAIELQETTLTIATSIGIAIGQSPSAVPEQLLDEADRAMYQAKRKGLPHVVFGDAGGSDFWANS
ncbi:sensor domain-containing diguanylate cyclase [Lyngbya sp. CCY1209]|uniref:sensor domain-containing diguanylate cyclase n=1 Tax=Lyngbya sp. CCY1209 TaxID=2886103 RepID=UPI002D21363A|nr:sensor domain-containing diguanylate cyclase [Lyngbya sp. CCY1209]MEB3882628.1 sensor domain-containing diguanylate cyclase [Lyngbya sp. CCY1209]